TAVERGDDGGAVDCERDGLANAAVGEGGVGDVEVDVPDCGAGNLGDFDGGRVAQRVDHVRCEDVGGGVGGTFLEFERGGDSVRHHVELQTRVGRETVGLRPAAGGAFEDDLLVMRLRYETVWARADGVQAEIG